MKEDYTDVTILIDRSGSMGTIKHDVEGGLKEFAKEQADAPGKCLLTLFHFDSQSFDTVVDAKPIAEVKDFTIVPRSATPLLDSVAKAIGLTGSRLEAMDQSDRPKNVVMMIATDGQENASVEMTKESVKKMVEKQTETYNWKFVYIGANQDAFNEASAMGIGRGSTMTYAANTIGTKSVYASMSSNLKAFRSGLSDTMDFNKKDRKKQEDAGA